jgi:hypothetical protein
LACRSSHPSGAAADYSELSIDPHDARAATKSGDGYSDSAEVRHGLVRGQTQPARTDPCPRIYPQVGSYDLI